MEPEPKPGQTPEDNKLTPETPASPPTPAPDAPPDWVKDPAKAYEEIQKLRTEAAERRTALKALEDAQAKRQADEAKAKERELVDQSKFKELAEQYQAERDRLQQELATEKLTSLRSKIAADAGLPPSFAARLQGTTEDELKADAEALKADMPAPSTQTPGRPGGTTTPVPGGPPGKETDDQKRARIFGSGTGTFGSK